MAWTELHDTLPDHPKIMLLVAELECGRAYAVGLVASMWCYALRFGTHGNLKDRDFRAFLVGVSDGRPMDKMRTALDNSGWIECFDDGSIQCHDWDDYAGRLELAREKDRKRKRAERAELKHLRGVSDGRPEDVQGTSTDVQGSPPKTNQNKPKQTNPTQTNVTAKDQYPDAMFKEFWDTYPRTAGKKAAYNAWKKLTAYERGTALSAVVRYRAATDRWSDDDKRFIKHGSTWLNAGDFETDPQEWERSSSQPEIYEDDLNLTLDPDAPVYRSGHAE